MPILSVDGHGMKRVGIYGGTFNPIHFGHLNLALELKEKKELAEVWVVPASVSPFRSSQTEIPAKHRWNMARLAFSDIPDFKVLEIELKRPAPSYTIDTIRELRSSYPNIAFFLMLGEDALVRFSEWKEKEELVKTIPFLIGSRSSHFSLNAFPRDIRDPLERGIVVTRQMEISATELRERLKNKLYCGHLIPAKVLDYICENQLYFEP